MGFLFSAAYRYLMNIFLLDDDIPTSVSYYVDSHANKITLETAQLLCWAHRVLDGKTHDIYYRANKSQLNNPLTLWVQQSITNYYFTLEYFNACAAEFYHRFEHRHRSHLILHRILSTAPANIPIGPATPYVLAMPQQYHDANPVVAYRNYYRNDKQHLFKWTNRPQPEWI